MKKQTILFLTCLSLIRIQAQVEWTGSQNSTWENPVNWSPEGIPGTNETVEFNHLVFNNITVFQPVLNLPATVNISLFATPDLQLSGSTIHLTGLTLQSNNSTASNITIANPLVIESPIGGEPEEHLPVNFYSLPGPLSDENTIILNGPISFTNNSKLYIQSSGLVEISGSLSGVNNQVTFSGDGDFRLNSDFTEMEDAVLRIDGPTTLKISNGTGSASVLNGGISFINQNGGMVVYGEGEGDLTVNYISGQTNALVTPNGDNPLTKNLTISNNTGNAESFVNFNGGVVANVLTINVIGTQRIETITANQIIINGGSLIVDNTTADISVGAGGVFGGSGLVSGFVSVQGTHAPGNSPGLQEFSSGLSYTSGAQFEWELFANTNEILDRGVSYDAINVTGGDLTIQNNVTASLVFNGLSGSGDSVVLWDDSFWGEDKTWLVFENISAPFLSNFSIFSSTQISQDSSGANLGDVRPNASFSWYEDNNNIYLSYTAIPEPGTVILMVTTLFSSLVFGCGRRFAKRHTK